MILGFVLFTGQTENSLDTLETFTDATVEETESLFSSYRQGKPSHNKAKAHESVDLQGLHNQNFHTKDLKNAISSEEDSGSMSHHSRQTIDLSQNIKKSSNKNSLEHFRFGLNNSNETNSTAQIKLKNLRFDGLNSMADSEVTRNLGSEYQIPDSRNLNLRNAFDQMVVETGMKEYCKDSSSEDLSNSIR